MSDYIIGLLGVRDHKGERYTNSEYVISKFVNHIISSIGRDRKFKIVTGGGGGVEEIICNWAKENHIDVRKIPPNITELGKFRSFAVRNSHVVTQCDELVVFWDGAVDVIAESFVTAMHSGKEVKIFPVI